MSTLIKVSSVEDVEAMKETSNCLIIMESKEQFTGIEFNSTLCRLGLQLNDVVQLDMLKSVAATLTTSTDFPTSVEFMITTGAALRTIVLGLLPTAVSRDNCIGRPHAVSNLVKSLKRKDDLVVILNSSTTEAAYAQSCAVGRQFPLHSLKSKPEKPNAIHIVVNCKEAVDQSFFYCITTTIENIRLAQRLVDTPPNILHTDAYVEESVRAFSQLKGCSMQVIKGKELEAAGFGGIWGVGKASEHLPALVILSYSPAAAIAEEKSICLVGKGITYDTGGLSIKTPGSNMAGMKIDMGGSAAVLGAFIATVLNDQQQDPYGSRLVKPLHALLCISENSVGPLSTRPDDVHTFLSGKTVEINNTDAEGRLVLADGCYFSYKHLNAGVIVDIATLTGAQLIATGRNHAAIYCSDEELQQHTVLAGKSCGDLVFPLPYCPEFYRNEFRSQVADMKNSVADRSNAQASCAAQFIGNHIEDHLSNGGKWVHIDMAGPVSSGERATGYGVALLSQLVRRLQ